MSKPALRTVIFLFNCILQISSTIYSDTWAVKIRGGEHVAKRSVEDSGFKYIGKIFSDFYSIQHPRVHKRSISSSDFYHSLLQRNPMVDWAEQQVVKIRVKRDLWNMRNPHQKEFTDPKWESQWYLHQPYLMEDVGMNVEEAWSMGITGRGVVVTILDDGIEHTHSDLQDNYDPQASYDINAEDIDPLPRYDFTNDNRHGTRCAGEVAAVANNSICGVGVAFKAQVGGIRMLDGDVTDRVEALSLSYNRNHIDIYSASWGPEDDGKTVDGPAILAREAFREGVTRGRNQKGSIFVWASGNGGRDHDNCNCDGYTTSIYTLSVSSATERGNVPWYSEACSSTLVSAYSSGDTKEKQIITTDLRGKCTTSHTGTSASAPLAAGIVALALEANPSLTWRDVQYIAVLGANPRGLYAPDWVTNGAGLNVSHHFGFGMMDAGRMVKLARNWTTLPQQRICQVEAPKQDVFIQPDSRISLPLTTTGCANTNKAVNYLEHVQAKISLTSHWRGALQIWLTSPSGTRSNLLTSRTNDDSRMGFSEWPFLTTHHWGEKAVGTWTLEIANDYRASAPAVLTSWALVLHGTETNPIQAPPPPTTATTTTTNKPTTVSIQDKMAQAGIIFPDLPSPDNSSRTSTTSRSTSTITSTSTQASPTPTDQSDHENEIPTNEIVFTTPIVQPGKISNKIENNGILCARGVYYPLKDSCVYECPDGWFEGRTARGLECLPCDPSCDNCAKVEKTIVCTQCYHGYLLQKGRCILSDDPYVKLGASLGKDSENKLEAIIIGATTALAILVAMLIVLLIYYVIHQRKIRRLHRISQFSNSSTSSSSEADDKEANSQSSSQLELMNESDQSDRSSTEISQLDTSPEDQQLLAMPPPLTTSFMVEPPSFLTNPSAKPKPNYL